METVYIETTIPSYLTALRSHREPMAAHQRITLHKTLFEYCTYHRLHMPCGLRGCHGIHKGARIGGDADKPGRHHVGQAGPRRWRRGGLQA